MGKIFLIDTESVNNYNFLKKYSLSEKDRIILFSSPNSKLISISELFLLHNSKAELIHKENLNLIDYQIVNYLSVNMNENVKFYIVTNNKKLHSFKEWMCNKTKCDIHVIDFSDYNYLISLYYNQIDALKRECKTKPDYHNALVKLLGNEIGTEYYNNTKDIIGKFDVLM